MLTRPTSPRSTQDLEQIGLYNALNRVARGDEDVDALLLLALRQRGLVRLDAFELTQAGTTKLMELTQQLGWVYPEV